ncbi:MAG: CGGC domain-containing protein [Syntrophomonadaceae bacterium]|nr:CGGC domain-containing protein [Syntrophomonadaceae bacterium]
MQWSEEAQKEIEKVPSFVRSMARKAVEKAVKKSGREEVTLDDVHQGREKYISWAEKKDGEEKKQRIAIVRCEIVSEVCPGIACFKAFNQRRLAFAQYDNNAEIIGFFTCGGCSGRRVSRLVDKLIKYNLTAVHLSSCMMLDDDYPRCPHLEEIKKSITDKGIKVVEGTHH